MFRKVILFLTVLMIVPSTVKAYEFGLSVQPGFVLVEKETSGVRNYTFSGAVDLDLKTVGGLYPDMHLLYYMTEINPPGGNVQGLYLSFGAKYKFNIKDKFYPFAVFGIGPYYHYAHMNSGIIGIGPTDAGSTRFGINLGAGVEIMFTKMIGMDITVRQYFVFADNTTLKILDIAPGLKLRFF